MDVLIIPNGERFMVLLRGGFTFRTGLSFHTFATIEAATIARRAVQRGEIRVERI